MEQSVIAKLTTLINEEKADKFCAQSSKIPIIEFFIPPLDSTEDAILDIEIENLEMYVRNVSGRFSEYNLKLDTFIKALQIIEEEIDRIICKFEKFPQLIKVFELKRDILRKRFLMNDLDSITYKNKLDIIDIFHLY